MSPDSLVSVLVRISLYHWPVKNIGSDPLIFRIKYEKVESIKYGSVNNKKEEETYTMLAFEDRGNQFFGGM